VRRLKLRISSAFEWELVSVPGVANKKYGLIPAGSGVAARATGTSKIFTQPAHLTTGTPHNVFAESHFVSEPPTVSGRT
jgi:hypothetical protein